MNVSLVSQVQFFLFNVKDQVVNSLNAQQRKVAFIVFAAFSALAALSCVYRCLSSSRVDVLKKASPQDSPLPEKIEDLLQPLKDQLLVEIAAAASIDNIQSAKIFIGISKENDPLSKGEFILQKDDLSSFDDKYLSDEIDNIFVELHPFIEVKEFASTDISFEVVLKAKTPEFYEVRVSKNSFGHSKIAADDINDFWNVIGDNRKLVNDQMEFIK